MNKYTVALCYPSQVDSLLLELIREKVSSFGLRAECLFGALAEEDSMGRSLFRLPRGYDLVIVVCDNTSRHGEYDLLRRFNHIISDPWATCVLAVGSPHYKGPQPTIAIEAHKYLGYFSADELPDDLLEFLFKHREALYERGLSKAEWRSIESCSSQEELVHIKTLWTKTD